MFTAVPLTKLVVCLEMNASRLISIALRALVMIASLGFHAQEVQSQIIAFPVPREWTTIKIDLWRSGCLGFCPAYRLEIRGDGTVSYEGQFFVALTGQHRGFVNPNDVRGLVNDFRLSDFDIFKDNYTGDNNRDCSTSGSRLRSMGKERA